jgi:hypothetical protein
VDRAGVENQAGPQFQGEGFHALAPGLVTVGEDAVIDLPEQALHECLDHGGLVREIGVHRVGCHTDAGGDTPHGRGVRPALVEQTQGGVEDLVLGEGPPRTPATSLNSRHRCGVPPLDFRLYSVHYLDAVQTLHNV